MSMPLESATIDVASRQGLEGLAIVDCDVHPDANADVVRHLPERWRQYVELTGFRGWPTETMIRLTNRPMANRLDTTPPGGGIAGSDPDFAREQLLDEYGLSYAILNNISLCSGGMPGEFEVELARATNDYNETWLEADPRWLSSINVYALNPGASVREVERCRMKSDRFVQVLLDTHLERPAGNPVYWPVFEAAEALGLPVAFHITGRSKHGKSSGVGPVTYYYEQRTSLDILGQTVVPSLIFEGTFDRFPKLKVALIEMDWTWVVPMAWRLDATWRVLRDEVPDLQRKPSEYLRDHFWFSTQPNLEPERPEQFYEAYDQFVRAGFGDRLMFATDYPHWDMDSPFESTPRDLPRESKQRILSGNAAALYGLDLSAGENAL